MLKFKRSLDVRTFGDKVLRRKADAVPAVTAEIRALAESMNRAMQKFDGWSREKLVDYIKDRRAQFCTGTMDPRNDAQWQEYLDGLKTLRYDEWVEIAQAAYDRMQK